MIEVRFHGRGGQGAKIASRILGQSGFLAGLFAQDFALFGAERRGAPVVSFTRLSTASIDQRGPIERPNLVVVMDDTLLTEAPGQIFHGVNASNAAFGECRSRSFRCELNKTIVGQLRFDRSHCDRPKTYRQRDLSAPLPPPWPPNLFRRSMGRRWRRPSGLSLPSSACRANLSKRISRSLGTPMSKHRSLV